MPRHRPIAMLIAAIMVTAACSGVSGSAPSAPASQCFDDALAIQHDAQQIEVTMDAVGDDLGRGDLDAARTRYRHLLAAMDRFEYRAIRFAEQCATAEGVAEIQTVVINLNAGRVMIREFCLTNLATVNFDC